MLKNSHAFSSFSVDDMEKAKKFYGETLGLEIKDTPQGGMDLSTNGSEIYVYPKGDQHVAANFTVLNFMVDDIEGTVAELAERAVKMEQYDFPDFKTDEKGILRGDRGPKAIAWFKDPAGNILSIIQEK